jgi:hypothetical protein
MRTDHDNGKRNLRQSSTIRLLAIACGLALFSTLAGAQTFTVRGDSGRNWVDTGIDVPANTRVVLRATGRVDVGAGWGSHGPEGTTRFANVPGYPAETPRRYGLAMRLTESRTNMNDELHSDFDYGTTQSLCGAGHLWLTANDDNAAGNTGQFEVEVTLETGGCSSGGGPPAPLRGVFRVRLNGFMVNNQSWDQALNLDGAGDEILFDYQLDTIDLTGRNDTRPRTAGWPIHTNVYGEKPAGSPNVRAGDAGANGGLRTGNSFPSATPWLGGSRETGPAFFNAELIQGRVAGVIVPAIFEWDGSGDMFRSYNRALLDLRSTLRTNIEGLIRGAALRTPAQFLVEGETLGLGPVRAATSHGASGTGERADRPVGMARVFARTDFSFVPKVLVLTYEAADIISRSDFFGKGRGIVEIRYRDDSRLQGDYTMYLQVERVY